MRFTSSIQIPCISIIVVVVAIVSINTSAEEKFRKPTAEEAELLNIPLGLDVDFAVVPVDNPITRDKIELGRSLYFDTRLSQDNTIACATCHSPRTGFTDGQPVSMGIGTQKGGRSAPTVINRLFSKEQFWDGRASSLEDQAKGPITNPIEMGVPSHEAIVKKLRGIKGYKAWFRRVFKSKITIDGIAKAIATFERTVISGDSAFDRHEDAIEGAMTESQIRGLKVFKENARCTQCHAGFNFTDEKFHNLGLGWDTDTVDLGLYSVTKNVEDIGKFKTPTVRDIAETGPYMHDGRFATLRQVIDFYDDGGIQNPFLDKEMTALNLQEGEKQDLENFLKALSGTGWQDATAPDVYPQ